MHVQILVQRLRVLHVAREGIEAVEATGSRVVEPGASLRSFGHGSREVVSLGERQHLSAMEAGGRNFVERLTVFWVSAIDSAMASGS